MQKLLSILSYLQTQCHFKLDFQKVNPHTGDMWLILTTEHLKDNQLQTWNSPVDFPSIYSTRDIKSDNYHPNKTEGFKDLMLLIQWQNHKSGTQNLQVIVGLDLPIWIDMHTIILTLATFAKAIDIVDIG